MKVKYGEKTEQGVRVLEVEVAGAVGVLVDYGGGTVQVTVTENNVCLDFLGEEGKHLASFSSSHDSMLARAVEAMRKAR